MSVIQAIQKNLEAVEDTHVKTSFWATDSEAPAFDIYHRWIGTPQTNPPDARKLLMFKAAKMIELAIVDNLVKSGFLKNLPEQQKISFEYEGVPVTGYLDGIESNDDAPVEVKTFYGDAQATELRNGRPKSSYVKQLGIYMYATDKDRGTLSCMDRGFGDMYEFPITRTGKFTFNYGPDQNINLEETFKRWKKIYEENILPKQEPELEFKYKYPIADIDFKTLSKSLIGLMRNNHKVHGDWQATYSPYLDLWLQKEGTERGYSLEELEFIREKTKGYSTK